MWLTTVTCTVSGDGGGEAETVTMDTSTPRTVASAAPRAAWAVTDQVSATVSENATASVHALPGERGGAGEGGGATTATDRGARLADVHGVGRWPVGAEAELVGQSGQERARAARHSAADVVGHPIVVRLVVADD